MLNFFKNKKTEKTKKNVVLVFDIGSASVGGALVLLVKGKSPKILYSVRKQMSFQNSLDVKKFTSAMFRSLKAVVSDLEKRGLTHLNFLEIKNKEIKEAFCFLSSPWSVSQTKIIEKRKNKSFHVSNELIKSFIRKEEKEFAFSHLDILDKNQDIELMDKKIIQFKLNGYKINNPYKKTAKVMEASLFLSKVNKNILDKIKTSIGKSFHLNKFHMHSFTLASFLTLRDIFGFENDFIFLDVSGEVTDISFVKNGIIRETQTFPLGRNSFIREIVKEFKNTYELSVSMLRAFNFNELDEKTKLKLKNTLFKISKKWSNLLEEGMFELSDGSICPQNIFILADDDISKILKETIEKERFVKLVFPNYGKIVNPILIDSGKINDICSCTTGEIEIKDVFLEIETLFINRLFGA